MQYKTFRVCVLDRLVCRNEKDGATRALENERKREQERERTSVSRISKDVCSFDDNDEGGGMLF